jgi:O-antigen/teichoic acid export membrane protein
MKDFIKGFIIRKGHFVSLALLADKVAQLLAPYIIVMYVSQLVYGDFIYGMTIIGLMIPFSGGGLNHSLLYYGSDSEDKRSLFNNILITGTALNFILVLVILMLSPLVTYNRPDSLFYLNILTIFMFFQFYHLILNNHYRINDSNLNYSKNNLVKSLIFVSAIIILVPNYGIYGLIIAYILSPLYSTVKSFKIFTYKDFSFKKSSKYIKYGVNVGLASIVSQMILLSDNIIIGNLIENAEQLSIYKIASIIPLGLFFIPNVFLTTDFVEISRMKNEKKLVLNYYKEYLKLFSTITLLLVPVIYFFSDYIIIKIFGIEYIESVQILKVLLIGTISVFLLRNPLGFILNAVGQAEINVKVSYLMLFINLLMSVSLTIKFGLIGAAFATSLALFFGGFITLFFFIKWLKE